MKSEKMFNVFQQLSKLPLLSWLDQWEHYYFLPTEGRITSLIFRDKSCLCGCVRVFLAWGLNVTRLRMTVQACRKKDNLRRFKFKQTPWWYCSMHWYNKANPFLIEEIGTNHSSLKPQIMILVSSQRKALAGGAVYTFCLLGIMGMRL